MSQRRTPPSGKPLGAVQLEQGLILPGAEMTSKDTIQLGLGISLQASIHASLFNAVGLLKLRATSTRIRIVIMYKTTISTIEEWIYYCTVTAGIKDRRIVPCLDDRERSYLA